MSDARPNPSDSQLYEQVLGTFYDKRPSLELSTLDLCFVVALQLDATAHGLPSFTEEQLGDAFDRVCEMVEPEAEQLQARATHAIRRLRQQKLLTRVDGAGVLRSGEYALSRLASAIVDFYIEDDALTEHSLELLSSTLLSSLNDVRNNARHCVKKNEGADRWQTQVIGPLRITISELILGIERRQRSLDAQQEQFQRQIATLLSANWFDAIEQCQTLLDNTARTLRQLSQLLLRYAHQFEEVLQDVLDVAVGAGQEAAEGMVQRVLGQVDRIASWGSARQQAWSEYYEHVHRYLRDVVRLDPSRALTRRLRQQLVNYAQQPFALTLAAAEPLSVPRALEPPAEPPPIRRVRPPKEKSEKQEEPKAPVVDPLEENVEEWLDQGVGKLSELVKRATESLEEPAQFRVAGRVAEVVARIAEPAAEASRPWVPVRAGLVIEDWSVTPLGRNSAVNRAAVKKAAGNKK